MSEYLIHGQSLELIGDAIRERTGTTDKLTINEMVNAISNLSETGVPVYAMLYDDGEMVLQLDDIVDENKNLVERYEFTSNICCTDEQMVPWRERMESIHTVSCKDEITFKGASYWFMDAYNLLEINNINFNKFEHMSKAYQYCYSLTGTPVCGDNVRSMYHTYEDCYNLTGSPVCGENVTSMAHAYSSCGNLTGSPSCGNNVVNMTYTYSYCSNLTGSPVCRNNVVNMYSTYLGCSNIIGSPVCGNSVTNMSYAYAECESLTGSPVCGNNVIDMASAYQSCYNLIGSPVCGNNVTNMCRAYAYCSNLTGSPICGENVTNMYSTYSGCYNLIGSPVCGNNVTDMSYAYQECYNLAGNAYFYSDSIYEAEYCFAYRNTSNVLSIYAPINSTTMSTILDTGYSSIVGGSVEWINDFSSSGCYYNTEYNIYIYPVTSVADQYVQNELGYVMVPSTYSNMVIFNSKNKTVSIDTPVFEYRANAVQIDAGTSLSFTINKGDLLDFDVSNMEVK